MTARLLISSEQSRTRGEFRARLVLEVTGPSVKPPQWAIDRALSHADSVVEAMAPGLDTILGLIALQAVEEKRPRQSGEICEHGNTVCSACDAV